MVPRTLWDSRPQTNSCGSQSDTDRQDADAVQKTLRGDLDAFADLVQRHQASVFSCALGITGNRDDAQDAAQEAFIRLYRHLDQYNPAYALRPYLMTIARNTAYSLCRRRHPTLDTGRLEVLADERPTPGEIRGRREQRQLVRGCLGNLPDKLREVCDLFYLRGHSCRETAAILKTTEGAVKTALHRARKRLAAGSLRDFY